VWWPFDLLANFRFQYALVLLVVVLVCLVTIRWKLLLIFLVPLLINVALVVPLYMLPEHIEEGPGMAFPAAVAGDRKPLRLLNINVAVADRTSEYMLDAVRNAEADVVVVQGLDRDLLDRMEYRVAPFRVLLSVPRDDGFGMALLIRVSMKPNVKIITGGCRALELPYGRDKVPAIEARIQWGSREVILLGVHVVPALSPRMADIREQQLNAIAMWVNQQSLPPIVLGSLSATPWSATFSSLVRKTGLVNSQLGFGIQPTWPAAGGFPLGEIPVDHCLHSRMLVTVDRSLDKNMGSDHRPLRISLLWLDQYRQLLDGVQEEPATPPATLPRDGLSPPATAPAG
jgi:endonuclease/exonuclease/phosphatase (EEP) superfamily protein YafD